MRINLLKLKIKKIFIKYGLSKKHSEICASYLIKAELLGAKSHGVARLKMYCDRLSKKLINPKPKIKIRKISSAVSYVDADDSIGFVSANIGIEQAIKNAEQSVLDKYSRQIKEAVDQMLEMDDAPNKANEIISEVMSKPVYEN